MSTIVLLTDADAADTFHILLQFTNYMTRKFNGKTYNKAFVQCTCITTLIFNRCRVTHNNEEWKLCDKKLSAVTSDW